MGVPFYNFDDLHHDSFKTEVKKRINNIIDNNTFVEGEFNQRFEKEFAEKQGAKHCLLVANGTDALEISLLAHDIGVGDKVGVPGITFYATAEAVLNVGATPVWIDIDEDGETGLLSPQSLQRMHEKHSLKAVIPVHIYGLPCPMDRINSYCQEKGIFVIEDAAQAQGTFYRDDTPVGAGPNLVTFSFYPTKNLSAFGDAGCILTHDDKLAQKIISLRNHGRGDEAAMGRNSRCDHIQAAVLHAKLQEVDKFNKKRKEVATLYHRELAALPIQLLPERFLSLSSWHLYPIQLASIKQREELMGFLRDKEIGCTPFYERGLSQELALQGYEGEDLQTKNFAGKTLCLPMNPFLSQEDIAEVVSAIKEHTSTL